MCRRTARTAGGQSSHIHPPGRDRSRSRPAPKPLTHFVRRSLFLVFAIFELHPGIAFIPPGMLLHRTSLSSVSVATNALTAFLAHPADVNFALCAGRFGEPHVYHIHKDTSLGSLRSRP